MVSIEQTPDSYRWFIGRHISVDELKKAFPTTDFPPKIGVGMVEPGDVLLKANSFAITIAMTMVLFVLQLVLFSTAKNTTVFEESYTCTDSLNNKTFVTPLFILMAMLKMLAMACMLMCLIRGLKHRLYWLMM
ncbi:MAG: hypothetical protein M0D57_00200 [Sphingobacteriales bacterium JAD_PAG50586_3]|nr:MAG: hypothetical protein M0D57_00200 [Sphingobacteriales bacterium JAD_PAG50586_3]